MLDDIYNRYHHLLENLDVDWINAQTFADAIHAAGAPLPNCWGFIDGTLRPCCRPIRNQRILFSGHKRVHGIKFQVPKQSFLTIIAHKLNVIFIIIVPHGLICCFCFVSLKIIMQVFS